MGLSPTLLPHRGSPFGEAVLGVPEESHPCSLPSSAPVAEGVPDSPKSCPRSRRAGCWLWTPLLRDRHADIPGQARAAIGQEGGPRVLLQGCCDGGKDRAGAEEVGRVAEVARPEAPLRLGPQHGQNLGGQQLVIQKDVIAPLPGKRAVEQELGAAAERAGPVAALGVCVPHGHAGGTETQPGCAVFIAPGVILLEMESCFSYCIG